MLFFIIVMSCSVGIKHTICLSDDGIVYAFGRNKDGQLGLEHCDNVSIPTPISSLPKITQVSCGFKFTVCLDEDGFMWSFGNNSDGQLGTGNEIHSNIPQKIADVPCISSVSAGYNHVLIITSTSNLWSVGSNTGGQLCSLTKKDNEKQLTPHFTGFLDISIASAGYNYSLIKNDRGELFGCGENDYGELGLGHNNPQIEPRMLPFQLSNIIQISCGFHHTLLLDSEGNVYGAGYNYFGNLGIGGVSRPRTHIIQIPNIPPIVTICANSYSSFLIDNEGNIWSFGDNANGILGHGDRISRAIPATISTLKNIRQISRGFCSGHLLVQDAENKIFVMGLNKSGALGDTSQQTIITPQEFVGNNAIWMEHPPFDTRSKSARK